MKAKPVKTAMKVRRERPIQPKQSNWLLHGLCLAVVPVVEGSPSTTHYEPKGCRINCKTVFSR